MTTAEVLKRTGIPRHKLYYLEQKAYIKPRRIPMGDLEAREYTPDDVRKIELVWKYLQMGFKHKVAWEKTLSEMDDGQIDLNFTSATRREE
ncbi:MAG: MerR family transcriptional regulator [Thermodesulfobacteriota bacterium]